MGLNWAVTGLENQEAACSLVGFFKAERQRKHDRVFS